MLKVRLPLSLLFSCAAALAPVAAFASSSSSTSASDVFPDDSLVSKQWQWYSSKNGINIASVWASGITGSGVVIGIIDTWVEPYHEDLNVSPYNSGTDLSDGLSKDFVGDEDLIDPYAETDDSDDDDDDDDDETQNYTEESHGTFVAGMAAAVGGNGTGVTGAAPGATIAGLHIGSEDDLDIDYATEAAWWASGVSYNSGSYYYTGDASIAIKNCSWGASYTQDSDSVVEFLTAVAATSKNNVIYVFAAGNERTTSDAPGSTGWDSFLNSKDVIGVAATTSDGVYSSFSSYGSNIFISAPGTLVVSTDRTDDYGYNSGDGAASSEADDDSSDDDDDSVSFTNADYATSSGTSFAAPIVSGVLALGKEVFAGMDVRWAKHALAYSSGYGSTPNIDYTYDSATGTCVQESTYTATETDDDGNETTVETTSTGNWTQNNGGYWFNNNYGFGLVDAQGFVDTVVDLAYITVETTETFTSSSISLASEVDPYDDSDAEVYSASYNVSVSGTTATSEVYSKLTQKIETVSVTVNFSEEALASDDFDVNSLKITLISPDGTESVLVQSGSDDYTLSGDELADYLSGTSYTFLTNAFWGSDYTNITSDWTVLIEYEGIDGESVSEYVTLDSVSFTLGDKAFESSGALSVAKGDTLSVYSVAIDSTTFTIAGTLEVEDSVYVNGGSLVVSSTGSVTAYTSADSLDKGGVIFVQNGGTSEFNGTATFGRGYQLYGGTMTLNADIEGDGVTVYGGTLVVSATGASITATNSGIVVEGGSVVVSDAVSSVSAVLDSKVTVNSGSLMVGKSATVSDITAYGGDVTLGERSTAEDIVAGKTVTGTTTTETSDADEELAATITVASTTTTVTSEVDDTGTLTVTTVDETQNTDGSVTTTTSSVSYYGGNIEFSSGRNTISSLTLAGISTATLDGTDLRANSSSSGEGVSISVTEYATLTINDGTDVRGTLLISGGYVYLTGAETTIREGISVRGGSLYTASGESTIYTDTFVATSGTIYIGGQTTISSFTDVETTDSVEYVYDEEGEITYDETSAAITTTSTSTNYASVTLYTGATLSFSADSDSVLILDGTEELILNYADEDDKITLNVDFGDRIPEALQVIKVQIESDAVDNTTSSSTETTEEEEDDEIEVRITKSGDGWSSDAAAYTEIFSVTLDMDNAPQMYDDDMNLVDLSFVAKYTTENDENGNPVYAVIYVTLDDDEELVKSRLYYSSFTELQTAVQKALLTNSAASASVLEAIDGLDSDTATVSMISGTYEAIGSPVNILAIDELHDKQANAITGAVSRRAREIRSGFIHLDTWSNPLLGNSGFSFSARPNLTADKGFVPYAITEEDFPVMVWVNGGYSFSEADDGAMSVSSTKSSLFNLVAGVDYSVNENVSVGVLLGYTNGRTKFDHGGQTDIQSRNLGVYITGCHSDKIGSLYGLATASFGFEDYDLKRKISTGVVDASATASPDGWQGIVYLEGGYEWKMQYFSMGPVVSLRYVHNRVDGYSESSADAWMRQKVEDIDYDSLQSSIGWRITGRLDFDFVSLLPEIRGSWEHEFIGVDEDFDARLAFAGSDSYTCTIQDRGEDFATIGVGVTALIGEVTTFSVDYDMQFLRDDGDEVHTLNLMVRTRF